MNKFIRKKVDEEALALNKWKENYYKDFTLPQEIACMRNVPYLDDSNEFHKMDIYFPKSVKKQMPVIINVHGGGLIMGDKEVNKAFAVEMAKQGFLVFAIDYRLVDDVTVFEQFDDVCRAMDKVKTLLPLFHGDEKKVYMVGDSAGGYLITYVMAICHNEQMAKAAKVQPSKLPVAALGLLSAMYYSAKIDSVGLFVMKNYFYGKGSRAKAFKPYINPEHLAIKSSLPPTFMLTAAEDYLRSYTLNYYKVLSLHTACVLEDRPEGLPHVFSVIDVNNPVSIECNKKLGEFLLRYEN